MAATRGGLEAVIREQIEALIVTSPSNAGAASQRRRALLIEDYFHIGGPHMTDRQAAQRLGVAMRTIVRWRRALRETS